MSIIPNKLKEELIDVGKVYNNGSCIISHPNSFDRLQTEIMKVCNEKVNLEKQLDEAKELLKKYNHKASCCGKFMKDWTVQKLWGETNKFLTSNNFVDKEIME